MFLRSRGPRAKVALLRRMSLEWPIASFRFKAELRAGPAGSVANDPYRTSAAYLVSYLAGWSVYALKERSFIFIRTPTELQPFGSQLFSPQSLRALCFD